MPIDPDNPFGFSYAGTECPSTKLSNQWGQGQRDNTGHGGQQTDQPVSVGTSNTADNFGDLVHDHTFDDMNGGTGDGDGGAWGDPTVINTAVAFNPTFIADNIYPETGSIGLYGRSRGQSLPGEVPHGFCIGVMGQTWSGCAVYGLATQEPVEQPGSKVAQSPDTGIGVVGRAMGGHPAESQELPPPATTSVPVSVEDIMGQQIGVLGHAFNGPGVRGHGSGPLLPTTPSPPPPPVFNRPAQPGGVFSSGLLAVEPIQGVAHFGQVVSQVPDPTLQSSQPQLRLTPSTGPALPLMANVGDFFLRTPPFNPNLPPVQPGEDVPQPEATLWLCVYQQADDNGNPQPYWRRVLLETGEAVPGGTPF